MKNLEKFKNTYFNNLKKCLSEYPEKYSWPESELPIVMERMTKAIEMGSFNKDSEAFKKTCKELNIKHTYKAINNFIKGL